MKTRIFVQAFVMPNDSILCVIHRALAGDGHGLGTTQSHPGVRNAVHAKNGKSQNGKSQ